MKILKVLVGSVVGCVWWMNVDGNEELVVGVEEEARDGRGQAREIFILPWGEAAGLADLAGHGPSELDYTPSGGKSNYSDALQEQEQEQQQEETGAGTISRAGT